MHNQIIRATSILALEAIRPDPMVIPIEYQLKSAPPFGTMTDEDIRIILQDKRKELTRPVKVEEVWLKWEPFSQYMSHRLDIPEAEVDEIINKFFEEEQNEHIRTCIRRLEYELRQRHNPTLKNTKEDLDRKKQEIPIRDVVARYVTLPPRARPGSLIPCPFPAHKEKTWSFMIYDKTNTCKCFGCNKWGSAIDFIIGMEGCSVGTAIQKFLQF